MDAKKLPRNTLVQASLEGRNNLGKSAVMESRRDKDRHNRQVQKKNLKKEYERSGLDRSFFMFYNIA